MSPCAKKNTISKISIWSTHSMFPMYRFFVFQTLKARLNSNKFPYVSTWWRCHSKKVNKFPYVSTWWRCHSKKVAIGGVVPDIANSLARAGESLEVVCIGKNNGDCHGAPKPATWSSFIIIMVEELLSGASFIKIKDYFVLYPLNPSQNVCWLPF